MPNARGREERGYHHGDARNALLDAARALVQEKGPAGFSLREVARRVGVDPAACYRHFRDRGELLIAVGQLGFIDFVRAMERAQHGTDEPKASQDAESRLLRMGRCYVDFAASQPAAFRVMFGEAGAHARDPRFRHPSVERSAFELLEEETARFLEERSSTCNLALATLSLWAVVHGVARLVLDGALPLPQEEVHALTQKVTLAQLKSFESPQGAQAPC